MRKPNTIVLCKEKHTNEYYANLNMDSLKTCSICKTEQSLHNFSKHRKQPDGFTYSCRKCNNKEAILKGMNLAYIKHRALKKNISFDITITDLFFPEYCPILNLKLNYNRGTKTMQSNSPSLDRIDNSKGYVKGNVIVISALANAMKSSATFDQIKLFSKNMVNLINTFENQGALGDITDIFPNIKERSLDL